MDAADGASITVTEDGPYLVSGAVPLARQSIGADREGDSVAWVDGEAIESAESYALCRCGHSGDKPFCDGSHQRVDFDGTESATTEPYREQAEEQAGPSLTLLDAAPLCAYARFCDVAGQVWNLVEQPGPEAATMAAREAQLCPSGRLVAHVRGEGDLEPDLEPSIGVVDDPAEGVAGPLWVRGGIRVTSAGGVDYEVRNRVTLCRCGASSNKPFCDGSHAAIGFTE